eukprot:4782014-Pyramimonas_sp.AAC.1
MGLFGAATDSPPQRSIHTLEVWYGVSGTHAEPFEAAMRSEVPGLFEPEPLLLHQLVTMVSKWRGHRWAQERVAEAQIWGSGGARRLRSCFNQVSLWYPRQDG